MTECWFDDVGDEWENNGVKPEFIYEFHCDLNHPGIMPGGMIKSKLPGGPSVPWDVSEIKVKTTEGELVTLSPMSPLIVTRWQKILESLA